MEFGVKVENVVIETIGDVVPDQLFIANFEDNFDFDNLVYVNQVKTEKIIAQDSDVLCKIFRYLPQRMKLFLIVLYIIRKIDTPLPQAILPDIDQEDKPLREKRSTKSRKRKNPDYVRAHHMFSRILKLRILDFLFVIVFFVRKNRFFIQIFEFINLLVTSKYISI